MAKVRVYMDALCPVCQRSKRMLMRLDWLGRLEFFDVHNRDQCAQDLPDVTYAKMLRRMFVKCPNGKHYAGFYGFRAIARSIPLLWLSWPFMWLPGTSWHGVKIYDFIARNRFKWAKCDDEICTLHMHLVSGKELDDETIQKVIALQKRRVNS
ncbi:DUF393 domain-containing protein [Planctomycetota bacterium]|nr:DUF393 domain-containing protein [Planctomycetota bacterium]